MARKISVNLEPREFYNLIKNEVENIEKSVTAYISGSRFFISMTYWSLERYRKLKSYAINNDEVNIKCLEDRVIKALSKLNFDSFPVTLSGVCIETEKRMKE